MQRFSTVAMIRTITRGTAVDHMQDRATFLTSRIRRLDQKGFVSTIREDGGRRDGYLTRTGAAAAILLDELMDFGLVPDTLEPLARQMNLFNLNTGKMAFDRIVGAVDNGEPVHLVAELRHFTGGDSRMLFRFDGMGDVPEHVANALWLMDANDPTLSIASVLSVDLQELLSGFLAGFDAAERQDG